MKDENLRQMYLIAIIFLLGLIILNATGCSNEPIREYNHEDEQDWNCRHGFGGVLGYCSKGGKK